MFPPDRLPKPLTKGQLSSVLARSCEHNTGQENLDIHDQSYHVESGEDEGTGEDDYLGRYDHDGVGRLQVRKRGGKTLERKPPNAEIPQVLLPVRLNILHRRVPRGSPAPLGWRLTKGHFGPWTIDRRGHGVPRFTIADK